MMGPLLLTLVMDGGRLLTVRLKLVEPVLSTRELGPGVSLPVMVTVWLCVGPSLVRKLHDQVPLPLLTTVPTEAVSVTVSPLASVTVPVLVAVWPSFTVTDALADVSTGGSSAGPGMAMSKGLTNPEM